MGLSSAYEVQVAGILGPAARSAFADLDVRATPPDTVLSGELDQSGLHGVIERVAALGLELVEVRRVTHDGGTSTRPDHGAAPT